jgi:hypothetical protein
VRVAERTRQVGVQVKGEAHEGNASKADDRPAPDPNATARRPAAGDTRSSTRADAPQLPMTRRTSRDPSTLDVSPLIRTIQYLDEVLKRGVVIGIFEGSMEVSDEDIRKALSAVRSAMEACANDMERALRTVARVTGVHEAPGALQ